MNDLRNLAARIPLKEGFLHDRCVLRVESRRGATAVGRRESLLPAAFAFMPVPQSPP